MNKATFSRLAAGIALGVLLSVPMAAKAADPGVKTLNIQTFYYVYRDGPGGVEGTMTLDVHSDGAIQGIYRDDYGRGNMQTVTGIVDNHDHAILDIGNGLQPRLHLAGYLQSDGHLHLTRQDGFDTWIFSGAPQLPNGELHPVKYED